MIPQSLAEITNRVYETLQIAVGGAMAPVEGSDERSPVNRHQGWHGNREQSLTIGTDLKSLSLQPPTAAHCHSYL